MKKYLVLTVVFVFLFSCANDDDKNVIDQETEFSFYGLQIGNSLSYEYFQRQGSTEDFESVNIFTTEEVVSKSNIAGEEIYTIETMTTGNTNDISIYPSNGTDTYQVKDSLGYLVRIDVGIQFSSTATTPYLISENEWGDVYSVLKDGTTLITQAETTFSSLLNEVYAIDPNNEQLPGKSRHYYADGFGLVLEQIGSVNNPVHFLEKRVVSYDIVLND
jgi:hypothetical protein